MNKKRNNVIKMLIVALGVTSILGTATFVSAAGRDLVGRGTVISAQTVSEDTSGQSAQKEETSGQQGQGSQQPSQQGSSQQGSSDPINKAEEQDPSWDASKSSGNAQGTSSQQAGTQQASPVSTGVMEQIYPFLVMLCINLALFALFVHLRLNQSRYGRSQAYYREIDDFHWKMKHLDD